MLASQSVILMPPPRRETWALESQLQAWVHYIPLLPDFSDLLEKVEFCEAQLHICQSVSRHATEYMRYVRGRGSYPLPQRTSCWHIFPLALPSLPGPSTQSPHTGSHHPPLPFVFLFDLTCCRQIDKNRSYNHGAATLRAYLDLVKDEAAEDSVKTT